MPHPENESKPKKKDRSHERAQSDSAGVTKPDVADATDPMNSPDDDCTKAEARDRQCATDAEDDD